MTTFLGSLWWMIVSLGVLVTFHEFGHYWVARRCGVKVLRFSVGFGKPFLSRHDRHGTEFALAAIPLGGYVKMLDEREAEVPAEQLHQAFNRKPVWQRMAVVAAGPVANLLLCVLLLWAMFSLGRPDYRPVVGQVQGIAADSGLREGDTLLAVDGQATPSWSEAGLPLITAALDHRDIPLQVRQADGDLATVTLRLSRMPQQFDEPAALRVAGIIPRHELLPPVVGTVAAGSAAAGLLQPGDRILQVDGQPVRFYSDISPAVQLLGAHGGGPVTVQRGPQRLVIPIQPRQQPDAAGKPYWALGVTPQVPDDPGYDTVRRYGPLAALPAALRETGRMTRESIGMLTRMVAGTASLRNVSGPVTIARVANIFAGRGLAWFLSFLALMSLSLAIINLLPIPLLDGGHLLYYLIELAKGSPLSERAMIAGQYLGMAVLAGLMGLAFYNDVLGLMR